MTAFTKADILTPLQKERKKEKKFCFKKKKKKKEWEEEEEEEKNWQMGGSLMDSAGSAH